MSIEKGVTFSFTIHFENLKEQELGALLWSLTLPGEKEKAYRHKLGMGKPLGMGAVHIIPKLLLSDRESRYQKLFDGNKWHTALKQEDSDTYIETFEEYILSRLESDHKRLADIERIQSLILLLQWRQEVDFQWLDETRYMEIEHGLNKINEYKERPVLPDPQGVVNHYEQSKIKPKRTDFILSEVDLRVPDQSIKTSTIEKWLFSRGYGYIKRDDDNSRIFFIKTISLVI